MWKERLPAEGCHHLPAGQRQGEDSAAPSAAPALNHSVVLQQVAWERWLSSSGVNILPTARYLLVSERIPSRLWKSPLWCTCALSAATLIAGAGLRRPEGPAGLSGAQGDVCVSHFLFVPFFFVTLSGLSHTRLHHCMQLLTPSEGSPFVHTRHRLVIACIDYIFGLYHLVAAFYVFSLVRLMLLYCCPTVFIVCERDFWNACVFQAGDCLNW